MKKILLWALLALLVLVVAAALTVHLFLDDAVKRGVETYGPQLTKVPVKLESVSLSLLSGAGSIKGLMVGNPEGYKSTSSIEVGTGSLALKPASLLSDKMIIQSIILESPMVTYETDLRGNNLSKILANLEGPTEKEPAKPAEAKPSKKYEVDDFLLRGAKLHVMINVLGGQSATVTLPEIRLKDMGKGSEGVTAAEISKQVLQKLLDESIKKAEGVVMDLSKGATYLTPELRQTATNSVEKVTKGLGDFLKKK